MATIFTYWIVVDGHAFGTDSKAAVKYLYLNADKTISVSQWNDSRAEYLPVTQYTVSTWPDVDQPVFGSRKV